MAPSAPLLDHFVAEINKLAQCNSIDSFLLPELVKSAAILFGAGHIEVHDLSFENNKWITLVPSAIARGLHLAQQCFGKQYGSWGSASSGLGELGVAVFLLFWHHRVLLEHPCI